MSLTLLESALAVLVIALGIISYRFWRSHRLHLRCVRLCHRIADELCQKQEPELVTDRIFKAIIEHTNATIGILSLRSGENDGNQVIRVHGLPGIVLSSGTSLGSGPGSICPIDGTLSQPSIFYAGLRDAFWTAAKVQLSLRQNMICIPVSGPGDINGLLQLVSSPGQTFTKQHLIDLGGAGFYLGAAIHNARLITTISRQRDAAEILYEIGLNISRFLDLEKVIYYAVKQGHRVMGSDMTWYLDYPDSRDKVLKIRKRTGELHGDFEPGYSIPISGQISALLYPEQVNPAASHLVFKDIHSLSPSELFCDKQVYTQLKTLGLHSVLIVPVRDKLGAKGLLCSFAQKVHAYHEFDINLMQRLSNHLLIALNTAQLHVNEQKLAVTEERKRLSDELHDNMAQVINGLSLELHSLVRRGRRFGVGEELLHRLDHIGSGIQDAKAAIREATFELRLPEDNQLWKSLKEFAIAFERWHELEVSIELPTSELSQPLELQREVLRIVQEMLWNTLRHSGVNQARLSGSYNREENSVRILVSDLGRGCDDAGIERGQGMATMRSRAARLDGRLFVNTKAEKGLTIALEFPAHG